MTLSEALNKAQSISEQYQCGQHVNFNVPNQYYYVSDWYDCDSTVATFSNGKAKE